MATTKHRITVTLDDEDYERLVVISSKFGKSLSWVVGYAVKGLTKEVGSKQFKVFKRWALEQPTDDAPSNLGGIDR